MSRPSVRPRPVDINRQLAIVRDFNELDNPEAAAALLNDPPPGGVPAATGAPADAKPLPTDAADLAQSAAPPAQPPAPKKKNKPKEIPVPEVKVVATYTREYLPLYQLPETYIRGKGGSGWAKDDYAEYDLDDEDEDWLLQYNSNTGCEASGSGVASQSALLQDARFERMLWKLDIACADAMDRALAGTATDKTSPAAVANTSYLSREEALAVIRKAVGGREQVLQDVYSYWLTKRKRHNRPLLRRLQAPTPVTDTNPFNVFRPREKANRPTTRRRRENSAECLDKMRTIRENLLQALELGELLILRERKKRDMQRVDVGYQRLQLTLRHQQKATHESVEAEAARHLREAQHNNGQCEARLAVFLEAQQAQAAAAAQQTPGMPPLPLELPLHQVVLRKRKRKELQEGMSAERVNRDAIAKLPPPPVQPADQEFLFAMRPDPSRLPTSITAPLLQADPSLSRCAQSRRCWHVGRGGRLMFTRVDGLTMERLVKGDEQEKAAAARAAAGGLPPGRLPLPSQRLGSLKQWWEWPEEAPPEPWAVTLEMGRLPCGVDADALLLQRQLQLQQQHAEIVALAALAGERLCPLGANNVAALSSAAAVATASAHSGLQQQLQAAMAVDAAVLTARAAPQPSPSVLAATKLLPPAVAAAGGGEGAQ